MADTDVEVLRRAYEAFNMGDLEAALSILHPDVDVEDHDQTLGPRTFRGRDGFMELVASVNEGFEDVRYTPTRFTDAGDTILVEVKRTGRGAASGVAAEERQFHVWRLVGGRAVKFQSLLSERDARRAASLDPPPSGVDTGPTMSQAHTAFVRGFYAAFSRGDMDAAVAGFDPEIVWRWPTGVPGATEVHGREQARTVLKGYRNAWDAITITAEEFIPLDGDRLLVPNHHRGRGRGSGVETETRFCDLYTFRDGRVVAFQGFWSKDDALETLGLHA